MTHLTNSAPKAPPFSISARIRSVGHAISGVAYMVRTQHSTWFHLIVTVALSCLAVWAHLSAGDWRWIIAAIFLVWVAEAINTAIEVLCDVVSPGYSVAIKRVKDVGAGAVLLGASSAAIIAGLTLWPYLVR
jgi:diacylglycerol kinase (ATP)